MESKNQLKMKPDCRLLLKSHDTLFLPLPFYLSVDILRHTHTMPPSASIIPCADADTWAFDRAVSLPEFWALVAARSGLVGAWRLAGVCKVARTGVREFLGTLPKLVVTVRRSQRG